MRLAGDPVNRIWPIVCEADKTFPPCTLAAGPRGWIWWSDATSRRAALIRRQGSTVFDWHVSFWVSGLGMSGIDGGEVKASDPDGVRAVLDVIREGMKA